MKITFPIARALSLLKTDELAPLLKYLQARRDETVGKLILARDHPTVLQLQGEVQLLDDLLKLVDESPSLMQKLR